MLKGMAKSKTLNFNVWIPVAMAICDAMGWVVPAEVWTGVLAVGNFLLRLITKESITEKVTK